MAADATLNVRMPQDLKERGESVFSREGVSTSKAVRGLYQYVDKLQRIPDWLREGEDDVYETRRRGMKDLVGIVTLPDDFDVRSVRSDRLSRIEF